MDTFTSSGWVSLKAHNGRSKWLCKALSYSRALLLEYLFNPFKDYHSSKDNMEITSAEMLEKSKDTLLGMIDAWEDNYYPQSLFNGEIFLAGHNLAIDRNRNLDSHRNMLRIMDIIDGSN